MTPAAPGLSAISRSHFWASRDPHEFSEDTFDFWNERFEVGETILQFTYASRSWDIGGLLVDRRFVLVGVKD